MPITSQDLAVMVRDAIAGANTDAADRVYMPGDWPTQPDQYPIVKGRLASEARQAPGRGGAPQFITTATIQLVAQVSYPAEEADAGAVEAENGLWRLKRQIEAAVINSYPLTAEIQQIQSIQSQIAFDSSGATHIASVHMTMTLEFYEGPDSFAPVAAVDLDEADIAATRYPPAGVTADLNP